MRKTVNNLLNDYEITQTDLARKMKCVHSNLVHYLSGNREMTKNFYHRCLIALQQIADDREIKSVKLKMKLNKLIMDMSDSNSIRDM